VNLANKSNTTEKTSKSPVVMKITFPVAADLSEVKYEIWYSSSHEGSLKFIDGFKPFHYKIAEHVDFSPKFVVWYCQFCQTPNWTVQDEEDCYSGGRYCAPDPDNLGPATGREVVTEDLRQKCIWKNRAGYEYWEYMSYMYELCAKTPVSDDCREQVYDKLGWDSSAVELIDTCTTEGFAGPNHNLQDNSVLKEEREDYLHEGVQYWPSIYIEHKQYQGDLEPEAVFRAICEKFTNPPDGCNEVAVQTSSGSGEGETDWWAIGFIVGTMVTLLLVALFVYRRSLKRDMLRDMNNQVSTMISQYYALNEGKNVKVDNIHDSL